MQKNGLKSLKYKFEINPQKMRQLKHQSAHNPNI